MALGFGFNKAKVLSAAEKCVQQGKFSNAINEYEKVIKADPKDLTVLNTVGDLYARLGRTEQAIQCFRKVGEAYAADGFTVKAIALFKKVAKLSPAATDCVMKLAELYTQQGLFNDARAQYIHIAEQHLRTGDNEQASRILHRMLEMDPENSAMQTRLADLYARMGRPEDAREIFFRSAESHYKKGAVEAADEALERVLSVDPKHGPALMLRGQIYSGMGKHERALECLEHVPNADSHAEALRAMLRSQLALKNQPEAVPLASKLLHVHNDLSGVTACADALMNAGEFEPALRLFEQHADRLLAANAAGLLEALHACIARVKDNAAALQMLRSLYEKAGETTHKNEVMELLAHASVQTGELARARDLYQQLAGLEPENPLHAQNYKQVVARLGEDSVTRELTAEEGAQAFMVDELEISAPALPQEYSREVAEAVRSAITDSELLDCYNLPAKALVPLQAVLPQAPRDPMLNQRLASLYARAERFRDAADCCETLQDVYWKAGHAEQAVRYADMAAKYRERAGAEAEPATPAAEPVAEQSAPPAVSEPLAVAEPPASAEPPTTAEPPAEPVAVHPEQAAAEGSANLISGEEALAGHLSVLGDLVEEVRFYLSQFMFDEAQGAIEKCAALAPDFTSLPELRQELAAARAKHFEMPEVEVEIEQPEAELPVSATDIEPPGWVAPATITPPPVSIPAPVVHAATPAAHTPEEPIPVVAKPGVLNDMVLELEQALHVDGAAPVVVSSDAQAAAAARAPVPQPTLSAAPVVPARVPDAVPVQPDSTLSDLFEEFKGEVEHETAAETDDPETHYNLGVAFREMGLLDEAIGELQKVCHAIDQGQPFPRTMETYTWLAQCLLDKGAPQAAIKWYERALRIPHLEQDARTAVYYELAAAQEASGNSRAALDNYMEVFATNIDYRDVAERIKSLQPVVKS